LRSFEDQQSHPHPSRKERDSGWGSQLMGAAHAELCSAGRTGASTPTQTLPVVVAAAEIVDEHLFYGLVVGHQNVADGVAADEVADFFG
jgi:hypothetical protein